MEGDKVKRLTSWLIVVLLSGVIGWIIAGKVNK
jgi:hypothetical protein